MKPPVIFLSFANDQDEHLPLLDEERKAINSYLVPLANEQYFQLFSEPSSSIRDLSNYIAEFKDRVVIFHYGGHAGSSKILLQDQEASSDGLAHLLSLQKNLKLVFLNGCSTKKQVDLLFQLGIPAVIATNVPISDPGARKFADVFYKSMATQHSMEESFKLAAANYLMEKGEAVGIYRDLAGETPSQTEDIPWGLYVRKGAEEVLSWKLPRQSAASFIVRGAGMKYQPGETMNKTIVETVANAIAPFSYPIGAMIEEAKRRGREPKMRDLRAAVIDSFPTPIGTHLRKLLLSEEVNTDRLQKIVNVYSVAVELLGYVMLAQLWDEKFRKPDLNIPEEQLASLKHFFTLGEEELENFNYMHLIRTIGDIFNVNDIEPFVEEFVDLRLQFHQDSEFEKAYRFLEEMKKELRGTIAANEIESFCVQAEEQLCAIFSQLGFCAKYTLATIKTIELLKPRHAKPTYRHNLIVLDRVTASFGVLDDVLVSQDFSDNNSVVLLRDEEVVSPFINLSPFVIDENALSGQQNSKIFLFRRRENGNFHYWLADNLKDPLVIDDENYPEVRQQMEAFVRELFGSL